MSHGRGFGMNDVRRRGRPPRVDGEVATARVWAWLTPRERAELERVANDNGVPVAALIREAVNEYVADYGERRVFPTRVILPHGPS